LSTMFSPFFKIFFRFIMYASVGEVEAGEFAVVFFRRAVVGLGGLDFVRKKAEMSSLVPKSYSSLPFASALVPVYPFKFGGIGPRPLFSVIGIL